MDLGKIKAAFSIRIYNHEVDNHFVIPRRDEFIRLLVDEVRLIEGSTASERVNDAAAAVESAIADDRRDRPGRYR